MVTAPFNPASGTQYKGANHIGLIVNGGYSDPRWMTYNQAREKGFQVKKGERSQRISFFSPTRFENELDENGKPVLDTDGKPRKVEVLKPTFKIANVFNASQIEGMEEFQPEPLTWNPVERAEKILANSGAEITHSQRDRAFYRPATDRIELPPKSQFATPESYYATAIHELAHWTQKQGRVERQTGPKGSEEYAKEELRAEIASWMINTRLGLGHDPSNHIAYTANWAQALKDDPKEIFRAARDAEKIKDFIMGFDKEHASERSQAREQLQAAPEHTHGKGGPDIAGEKTWLAVPYPQKNQARKLGAHWDAKAKSWYAPEGADLAPLSRWLPENLPENLAGHSVSPASPDRGTGAVESEFAKALRDAGLDLQGQSPVMDGNLHRVPVTGGKTGNKDGAYIGHLDGLHPAGFIQNHLTGHKQNWHSNGHCLSDAEKARLQAEAAGLREQRAKEREQGYAQAADKAQWIYDRATPADGQPTHPYLKEKQIAPDAAVRLSDRYDLVIPLKDVEGNLRTLQFISIDGDKKFLPGGRKNGAFHVIGGPDLEDAGALLLAEGYATGATCHQATQMPVIVCFDSSNLLAVAKALYEKHPTMEIVICADNDADKAVNVGLEKAREAAAAVGGRVVAPQFPQGMKGTDFNDLCVGSDLRSVSHQLAKAVKSAGKSCAEMEM